MSDPDEALALLTYSLERNITFPVIAALFELEQDNSVNLLRDAAYWWQKIHGRHYGDTRFAEIVTEFTGGTEPARCGHCNEWVWHDETDPGWEQRICEDCISRYTQCYGCDLWFHDDNITSVGDHAYCDRACLDRECWWCDYCDEWTEYEHDHEDEDDDDDDGCMCDAPHLNFRFPANGAGTVCNDERIDVTMPAGMIDGVGIRLIRLALNDACAGMHGGYQAVSKAMEEVGEEWQTKRGNYTRRISSALYKAGKIKVPGEVLSEIGNLARQHSSETTTWSIEFTRNLNLPADEFCHAESCWWGGYSESRCALKSWGGLGMRVFSSDGTVVGRVWVQPITVDGEPTHDTLGAHGYVVFNAYNYYGDSSGLNGYKAARIIGYLTGRTYKKIVLTSTPQFINGDSGFLVADEATCADTESIAWTGGQHDKFDAYTIGREVAA
jgi:hypothetical protein